MSKPSSMAMRPLGAELVSTKAKPLAKRAPSARREAYGCTGAVGELSRFNSLLNEQDPSVAANLDDGFVARIRAHAGKDLKAKAAAKEVARRRGGAADADTKRPRDIFEDFTDEDLKTASDDAQITFQLAKARHDRLLLGTNVPKAEYCSALNDFDRAKSITERFAAEEARRIALGIAERDTPSRRNGARVDAAVASGNTPVVAEAKRVKVSQRTPTDEVRSGSSPTLP